MNAAVTNPEFATKISILSSEQGCYAFGIHYRYNIKIAEGLQMWKAFVLTSTAINKISVLRSLKKALNAVKIIFPSQRRDDQFKLKTVIIYLQTNNEWNGKT